MKKTLYHLLKQKKLRMMALITGLIVTFLNGCSRDITEVSQTGFFFDTAITIKLYESGQKPILSENAPESSKNLTSEDLLADCFEKCAYYEQILSRTLEGSDVYNINASRGARTEVSEETTELLSHCLEMCRRTDGRFDITIAPLSSEWGFSSDAIEAGGKVPPDAETIDELLTHVDYENVIIEDTTHVRLADPDTAIDLGAAAKGYIADRLRDELISKGAESAIIDLGGNILCIGAKPDGTAYTLGVRKPFSGVEDLMTTVKAKDASLVTSGVYERYYEYNGRMYHHLLDTQTGYPYDGGIYSVSILSPSSMSADLYSTACFLMGPEKGLALAEADPNVEALFITDDYQILKTSHWPQ